MEIAEAFKEDVDDRFLSCLNKHITIAYESARKAVDSQGLGINEKYNVSPLTRRGHVETALRRAANECGLELTTQTTGGFWRHVVITCGRFRITQTTTMDSESPLRKAAYKCVYANEQQLLPGFEDMNPKPSKDDPHLYAVIIHRGPVLEDAPDFMKVRFPKPELDGYHPGEIDLAFYAEIPMAESSVDEERIEDHAVPKLKLKQERGAG